jgi:hypothetical protein
MSEEANEEMNECPPVYFIGAPLSIAYTHGARTNTFFRVLVIVLKKDLGYPPKIYSIPKREKSEEKIELKGASY